MCGYEQSWGQNCTEIAPATPQTNWLSALLRLATYTYVDQELDTGIHYRAIGYIILVYELHLSHRLRFWYQGSWYDPLNVFHP